MTFHLKIQKLIPTMRKAFENESNKQYILALEIDTSQRIRYLVKNGEIFSNQRVSLINIQKDVYCTSGLKQCIEVVLYEREKRNIEKEPIHMERQKIVRVATIHPESLLKLYQKRECKNMEACTINIQMKTKQREHYLIKRDLPNDDFDCKVDLTFKYDKFRICRGNMPLSKMIHKINLSQKKQTKIIPGANQLQNTHQHAFNSTNGDFGGQNANNNLRLSQRIQVPNINQDQPVNLTQQQFIGDKSFYAGRCATTNLFSCCDNLFYGIDDSSIKFQIVQQVYR